MEGQQEIDRVTGVNSIEALKGREMSIISRVLLIGNYHSDVQIKAKISVSICLFYASICLKGNETSYTEPTLVTSQ